MIDDATCRATGREDAMQRALRRISRDYPGWHAWKGVCGLLYARIVKSSPQVLVRAATLDELRAEIARAEGKRSR